MKKFLKGFKEWLGIAGLAVGLVTACFGEDFMQNWGPPVFFFFVGFLTARAWDRYDRRHEEKERREEERRREEEERRREEEERRRKEEEKKDAVDSVLFRLCLLSPCALLLLAAINKTRERLEVFDDSPSVRCGRLTFSHVEVDDLRRAGYLEKVEDNRGGARVVYRLTDQGAAAFLVGRSKGLFDGLEV